MTAKDLKNALLQEAVQGKLVPQIKSEGNAKDLLEEIKKEKTKLIKEKKLKKDTTKAGASGRSLPEITKDEIPFDIPENWCWCRLGEVGDFVRGSGIKRDETTNIGLPCVRYGEMYTTYKIKFSKTKSFTSKDVFEKCHKIHTNDILMALTGENKWDIALAATYEGTEELAMGGDLCKFTPINCNSLFLVYLINSPYGIEYKRNTSTGDIIVHTSTTKLGNLLIPLPPLAEQKRIVAAIEKFMPLIEEYGKKETELKAFNEQIGALTKKAILQEAVQGKLVPQIAAEGNAKDLLEEIRKERLSHGFDFANAKSGKKKSKKETALAGSNPCDISDDEIPFDIPESWCWCRLGEISTNITAGGDKPSHFSKTITEKLTVPVISNGEKNDGVFGYTDRATITEKAITVSGRGNIGFTKVRNEPFMPIVRLITITFPNILDFKYLEIAISFLVADGNGSAVQQLTVPMIKPLLIPLPPLAEQKRIVDTIEKMLPLCEKLGE